MLVIGKEEQIKRMKNVDINTVDPKSLVDIKNVQIDEQKPVEERIRQLIQQFLISHPEISVHAIREDDGYTGTNFSRPGFQLVLQNIKEKKINCIIVKDLFRVGRNYLQVGEYV